MSIFLNFLAYSNLFIAFCAFSFIQLTYHCFELPLFRFEVSGFVFCSTLFAYTFQRFIKREKNKSAPVIQWMQRNRWISLSMMISGLIGSLYFFFQLPNNSLLILIPLTLISIWYAVGLIQIQQFDQPLREVPYLKIFLIAFVWAGSTVIFPLIVNYGYATLSVATHQLFALWVATFVFAETIPFDIRDMKTDQALQLKTIPAQLGIPKSKSFAQIVNLLGIGIIYYLYKQESIDLHFALSLFIASLSLSIIIFFVNARRKDLFYGLILESALCLPWLWLLLIDQ